MCVCACVLEVVHCDGLAIVPEIELLQDPPCNFLMVIIVVAKTVNS